MPRLPIRSMGEHAEWVEPCAEWWHRQWGDQMGFSPDAARTATSDLTLVGGRQAALIAFADEVPAGSVFVYLYTTISEFYRPQGWTKHEALLLHGVEHEIMVSPPKN